MGGPPRLVERIGAEQNEPVLLGDDCPAGAKSTDRATSAGLVARQRPDRVPETPLHEAHARLCEQEDQQQRDDRRGDRLERIGAQPPDHAAASGPARSRSTKGKWIFRRVRHRSHQRSTSAVRALYQFMKRLMPRLMVRNTSMMSAMASMAWPVWFSVVFAIDTMS